jgi:hypothetical protein
MARCSLTLPLCLTGAALVGGCGGDNDQGITYTQHIKPTLDRHCVACHVPGGEGHDQSGLRLDSYADIMKGTRHGPVVIPRSSISSSLYLLVTGKADPSIRMPHGREGLPPEDVENLRAWIDQGAAE